MKVLIKQTNQIKEVNDSYAVNYLIPKGLAVLATQTVVKNMAAKQEAKDDEAAARRQRQQELAKQLDSKTITLKLKANNRGELYAAAGASVIKKALHIKESLEVLLKEPIKEIGTYEVPVKIGSFKSTIKVEVKNG